MPEAHSKWSASGFKKIMLCPGSKVLEVGQPDNTTIYAAEGTAAHELLEMVLTGDTPASGFVGRIIQADGFDIEVTDEMAEYIQGVADRVKDYQGPDGVLFVEQKLYYADYLDVPREEGWGTGDVVICRGDEIIVIDLKYGKGTWVDVKENPQLQLYGLGALDKFNGIAGDFNRVRLVIDQPRISTKPSEWDTTVEALEAWGRSTARSVVNTCINAAKLGTSSHDYQTDEWEETFLRPGEDQCKFCKAKATCPALRAEVSVEVHGVAAADPSEFVDFDIKTPESCNTAQWLAACLNKVDLIEDWCKAVRAEADRRLLNGEQVPGYKVVAGKKGNRAWGNAKDVEEVMKSMRMKLEDMYDFKLISPTTAEKLAKAGTIGPRQWPKLQALITQADGKPHVAPVSDPRPALDVKPVTDDFVVESLDDLA
jgi:hypothetical protein